MPGRVRLRRPTSSRFALSTSAWDCVSVAGVRDPFQGEMRRSGDMRLRFVTVPVGLHCMRAGTATFGAADEGGR